MRKIVNRSSELEILVGFLIPTTAEVRNKLEGFQTAELIIWFSVIVGRLFVHRIIL